ncbi:hypothetical protein TSUD_404020 [Trifolium subterraneum]|uniref:Uncharacterized protein n=1 Tax=Trifolium subterraneum TaxID=3900 RepID=A0A2Z6NZ33_TRISU|nr:hypothetical protein TSUD_404020 [Trifolium subterraneum]
MVRLKNRSDASDVNHIITLFLQLTTQLEASSKNVHGGDVLLKSLDNDLPPMLSSTSSKYKKSRLVNERKYRSNGKHNVLDNVEYTSDREIRRRLTKLNKKSMGSESETSDDLDRSFEDEKSDSDTTTKSESDHEVRSQIMVRKPRGDGCFSPEEELDFITDDRE